MIRENTEGPYIGDGGFLRKGTLDEVATQGSVNTRMGVERAIRYAFELARRRDGRKHVTMVHKTNILVYAGDLWERTFNLVAADYPDVATAYHHADAACIYFVQDPHRYDVVVTDNLFGDILTDLGGAVSGGIGLAASANLNPARTGPSMFEPVHGSAPDITGQNKANPTAAVLSAAMMMDFLGEQDIADRMRTACEQAGTGSTTEIGDRIAGDPNRQRADWRLTCCSTRPPTNRCSSRRRRRSSTSSCRRTCCATCATNRPASPTATGSAAPNSAGSSPLVDEEHGGGAVGEHGLVDLTLIAHEFGRHAAPGPLVPTNVVAALLSHHGGEGHADAVEALVAGTATAAWCLAEPAPNDRLCGALGRSTCASTATRSCSTAPSDRSKRRPAPTCCSSPDAPATACTNVLVPAIDAGRHRPDASFARADAALRQRRVRRRPAPAQRASSASRERRPTTSSGRCCIGLHDRRRRVGRGDAGGVRHDRRVGVRSVLVRSSAGVVPGAQAPLRRHEVVARSEPRDRRRRGGGGGDRRPASRPTPPCAAAAFIGEYGTELAHDCVQIHGGIGVTFEHDLHFYLRRIVANRSAYGSPAEHRQLPRRLARAVTPSERTSDVETMEVAS